jgi:hypothetical protein
MIGKELLAVQSIFIEPHITARFDEVLLRDLAGNAFEASCCAAILFAQCILLSSGAHQRHSQDASVSGACSEDDSDIWAGRFS